MTKKLLILATIICLAGVSSIPAQEQPPVMEAAHNAVARFLQLDESQVATWDELYADHKLAEQPVQEAIADIQSQLEDLFAQEDPDPTTVGELTLQRRALGEELGQIHSDYNEAFMALLEEEQAQRLNFIRRANDLQKFIPAFKAFELIRRN